MIDTRHFTIVSNTTELPAVIAENVVIKKQNNYLLAGMVLVTIIIGIVAYQNLALSNEKYKKTLPSF